MWNLDDILDLLDQHHQRATYGAVAELVGTGPNIVMGNRPRDPRHSWVVNRETELPTGYTTAQMHPQLRERDTVFHDANSLQNWLQNPS
jgi:alkylated DNA nucleotide flippase Atl1